MGGRAYQKYKNFGPPKFISDAYYMLFSYVFDYFQVIPAQKVLIRDNIALMKKAWLKEISYSSLLNLKHFNIQIINAVREGAGTPNWLELWGSLKLTWRGSGPVLFTTSVRQKPCNSNPSPFGPKSCDLSPPPGLKKSHFT